jgi:integrase
MEKKQPSARRRYRPAGTGTVRRRGGTDRAPIYEASYFVAESGRGRQISRSGFRSKAEAESWLQEQLGRVRTGRAVVPTRSTTAEVLDLWMEAIRPRLSPSTELNYVSIIEGRLKPLLGDVRASALTPEVIDRAYRHLRVRGSVRPTPAALPPGQRRGRRAPTPLSETSLRRTHAVLRSALAWAVRQRWLPANAADDVEPPKVQSRIPSSWDASDLRRFLAASRHDRLGPLFHLAAFTGMRRGELLGLRWTAVELDRARVSVVGSRIRVVTAMVGRSRGKSAAAIRTIDIDEATVAVLRRWRDAQAHEFDALGVARERDCLVFTRLDGTPLKADDVATTFKRLKGEAGVPDRRFHDLRHTHATLLLRAGTPLKVVSERLGHASPAFTMTVYQHVLPGMQAEAANRFAGVVGLPEDVR